MAVQTELGFKAQRIARAESNRLRARVLAGGENGVPHWFAVRVGDEQFKTVLAGIARARNDAAFAVERKFARGVIFQIRDRERFNLLQNRFRLRTLKREHVKLVAHILQGNVETGGLGLHPRVILVAVAGVDDDHPFLFKTIHERIIHARSIGITHHRVFCRIDVHGGKIRGEQAIEKFQRVGARDAHLTHVVNIKESGDGAHSAMFFDDALILHGHFPAAEFHHFRAERAMRFVQRGPFQFHTFESCEKFARRTGAAG
ncbi:MAG: hypothetical protein HDKAJFGB_00762 [Anaerolineae bacterium]|nr:hypothetical protein [Anaerolineae bacterium]